MTTWVVTYTHPDEDGWTAHVGHHVDWLVEQVAAGTVRASGPFAETPVRSAMLIMEAPDRPALDAIIATDPFAIEGIIDEMAVTAWEPIFGALA